MSKFDELCAAFKEGRDRAIAERDEAWNFQARFASGLKNYLDCPDWFQFVPVISPRKKDQEYTPQDTLERSEDGFWHFGMVLRVYAAANQFLQFLGQMHIAFKKSGASFIVKPAPDAPEITIQGTEFDNFKPAYEALFEMIKAYFIGKDSLSDGVEKRIGFRPIAHDEVALHQR